MCPHERTRSPRVLYVVYWGAAEPLGQSLVLPAVRRLATLGVRLTLVTFEKPADLKRADAVAEIRADLHDRGVPWLPLRYHKRPRVPATAFDVAQGVVRGALAGLQASFDIVHARTFIGGLMGPPLARALGARLVYHNEGFYPDEQVDGGVWRLHSPPHRLARFLERRLYASADGLIALSHRARLVIEALPAVRRRRTPAIVVPSCVDLDLFRRPAAAPPREGLRLAYIGSIGLRYIFDRVARFVAVAAGEVGPVRLRVLTGADHGLVQSTLRAGGLADGAWSIDRVPHARMPAELAAQHAGLFFLTQGISEHGCSPTKIGEYWATGLPVVTTPNVSDTDEIVRRERVGVIVREHTDAEYRRAARELRELLADPDLPRRCRAAAEEHYGLAAACERQVALYAELMRPGRWGEGGRTS
jgi:glycosyltransferase involved in cell wall biosynthesis